MCEKAPFALPVAGPPAIKPGARDKGPSIFDQVSVTLVTVSLGAVKNMALNLVTLITDFSWQIWQFCALIILRSGSDLNLSLDVGSYPAPDLRKPNMSL